jgi:DNA-binding LytR/AlgR family response regulator
LEKQSFYERVFFAGNTMNALNIGICEDETVQAEILRKLVLKWAERGAPGTTIRVFPNAGDFLREWRRRKGCDILLLDVQLGDGQNGIELARELRKDGNRLIIVFVSAFDDFIGAGYDVSALHYLLKPVSEEKLNEVLNRAREQLLSQPRYVILPIINIRLKAEDICYARAFSHYVEIYTTERSFRIKISMNELEELLGNGFFRCHRSYIAGMAHVNMISRGLIVLDTGATLPLSRRLYDDANQAFIRALFAN